MNLFAYGANENTGMRRKILGRNTGEIQEEDAEEEDGSAMGGPVDFGGVVQSPHMAD